MRNTVGTDDLLATTASSTRPKTGGSTTQRIRVEVGKQTRRVKLIAGVLMAGLIILAGGFAFNAMRQRAAREAESAAFQERIDSILGASEQAIAQLQGQMQGLAHALEQSQTDVQRLTGDLTRARQSGNSEQVTLLTRQLQDASDALRYQQAAAQVDFRGINEANHRAVAMIWTDFGDGDIAVGTAFGVRADGRMGTNR